MEIKDKNKKARCSKNAGGIWPIPARVTATVVGCGESTVSNVRAGIRSETTRIGQKIVMADTLLEAGTNLLIKEIKKAINSKG